MNPMHTLYVTAALLAMMSAARAEVDVAFTAPEKYVDASLRREGGASAREVALRTIREQLVALGERYLAPNQTLKIEVLDIDLAGEIEWWHGPYDIRYLRDYTWPKIKLRYTLEERPDYPKRRRNRVRSIIPDECDRDPVGRGDAARESDAGALVQVQVRARLAHEIP
jgi:DUF3016 family protein